MSALESDQPNPNFEQIIQLLSDKNPGLRFETIWYVNDSPTSRYLNIEPWGYGPDLEPNLRYALVMGWNEETEHIPLDWRDVDKSNNNVVTVWAYADQQRVLREDGTIVWSNENGEEELADLETLKKIL